MKEQKTPKIEKDFKWDGERIKLNIKVKEKDLDPADILGQLAVIRGNISKMEASKLQGETQMKTLLEGISDIKKSEEELMVFEEKCIDIQKEKLDLFIRQIWNDSVKEAEEKAAEIIAKDKHAYTDEQVRNQKYTIFQSILGQSKKIAERIAPGIIRDFVFDKPIFDNPFAPVEEEGPTPIDPVKEPEKEPVPEHSAEPEDRH